mmetsp:Transcript_25684/g.37845  ORF Transcript_25684/g.37845 Transcript_25684/m.37845 type:complete len:201 (-) Transcript_25684:2855-3457(-)
MRRWKTVVGLRRGVIRFHRRGVDVCGGWPSILMGRRRVCLVATRGRDVLRGWNCDNNVAGRRNGEGTFSGASAGIDNIVATIIVIRALSVAPASVRRDLAAIADAARMINWRRHVVVVGPRGYYLRCRSSVTIVSRRRVEPSVHRCGCRGVRGMLAWRRAQRPRRRVAMAWVWGRCRAHEQSARVGAFEQLVFVSATRRP